MENSQDARSCRDQPRFMSLDCAAAAASSESGEVLLMGGRDTAGQAERPLETPPGVKRAAAVPADERPTRGQEGRREAVVEEQEARSRARSKSGTPTKTVHSGGVLHTSCARPHNVKVAPL